MRKDGIIRRVALSLAFAAVALCAGAENKLVQDMNFVIRFGYNIGGTAPVGMPASIRSLNEF